MCCKKGNYTYIAFATNREGENFSLQVSKGGIKREYIALYVSNEELDTNDLLFPNYFHGRWVGMGDMFKNIYDPEGGEKQVEFKGEINGIELDEESIGNGKAIVYDSNEEKYVHKAPDGRVPYYTEIIASPSDSIDNHDVLIIKNNSLNHYVLGIKKSINLALGKSFVYFKNKDVWVYINPILEDPVDINYLWYAAYDESEDRDDLDLDYNPDETDEVLFYNPIEYDYSKKIASYVKCRLDSAESRITLQPNLKLEAKFTSIEVTQDFNLEIQNIDYLGNYFSYTDGSDINFKGVDNNGEIKEQISQEFIVQLDNPNEKKILLPDYLTQIGNEVFTKKDLLKITVWGIDDGQGELKLEGIFQIFNEVPNSNDLSGFVVKNNENNITDDFNLKHEIQDGTTTWINKIGYLSDIFSWIKEKIVSETVTDRVSFEITEDGLSLKKPIGAALESFFIATYKNISFRIKGLNNEIKDFIIKPQTGEKVEYGADLVMPQTKNEERVMTISVNNIFADKFGNIVIDPGYKVAYDGDISGLRNGVNNIFTINIPYVPGSLKVYIEGILLSKGNSYDYIEHDAGTGGNGAVINRVITPDKKLIFEFIEQH